MAAQLTFALAIIGFVVTAVMVLTLSVSQYVYIVYRAWRTEADEVPSPSLWQVARRAAWIYGVMTVSGDFRRVFGEPTSIIEGRSAHGWFSFWRRACLFAFCATFLLVLLHIGASMPTGRR